MSIWIIIALAYCIVFAIVGIFRVRSELPKEKAKVIGARHRPRPEEREKPGVSEYRPHPKVREEREESRY